MSSNLQARPDTWPATATLAECDAYEQAFMRTVLTLNGIQGKPTPLQLAKTRKILRLHGIKVALASIRNSNGQLDMKSSRLTESSGVEHAFVYVTFDSVLVPDESQVAALRFWLASGVLPVKSALAISDMAT